MSHGGKPVFGLTRTATGYRTTQWEGCHNEDDCARLDVQGEVAKLRGGIPLYAIVTTSSTLCPCRDFFLRRLSSSRLVAPVGVCLFRHSATEICLSASSMRLPDSAGHRAMHVQPRSSTRDADVWGMKQVRDYSTRDKHLMLTMKHLN